MLYHPDADTANLHQRGCGKIAVSAAGDLTSHTLTADRYMVMNKLKNTSGTNLTCTLLVNIITEQRRAGVRIYDPGNACRAAALYAVRYPRRSLGRISNLSKAQSGFGNSDRRMEPAAAPWML